MRAGALSDPAVASLLYTQFVCAWEKKGAVESYRVRGAPELDFKTGGNILSYVCSPRGEVIHVLPGSWKPGPYLQHLEWALKVYRDVRNLKSEEAAARVRDAHREPSSLPNARPASQSNKLLATQACRPIREVEKEFFEYLLDLTYAPEKDIVIREIDKSDYENLLANVPRG